MSATNLSKTGISGVTNTGNLDWDSFGGQELSSVIGAAGEAGLINKEFLQTIKDDEKNLAFYMIALNNNVGGYTSGDVLNDLKRREMAHPDFGNNSEARELTIIDPEMTKQAYYLTAAGQKARGVASTLIPTFDLQGFMDPGILEHGTDIPDEFFKMLTPLLDIESQEFKDAVSNVKSAFYDLLEQGLKAETEQEKVVADDNYREFKEQIEKQYGIALSDDATQAWEQIENLGESFGARGLAGTGMEREAVDDALDVARKRDQRLREEKLTQEEKAMAAKYKASADPGQIQSLIDEDKAKGLKKEEWRATRWGLVPSDDMIALYSMDRLREEYPDKSEEWLKKYRDQHVTGEGENMTYRSSLYKNYYTDIFKSGEARRGKAADIVLTKSEAEDKRLREIFDLKTSFSGLTEQQKKFLEEKERTLPPEKTVIDYPEFPQVPTETARKAAEAIQERQRQVDAANKAAQAASKITKRPYTPGTVQTYFPQLNLQKKQQQVEAANKAAQAASKITKRPYTPGTVQTYFPQQQPIVKPPTSPKKLTPEQINKYYSTEGKKTSPLSPLDWLSKQK